MRILHRNHAWVTAMKFPFDDSFLRSIVEQQRQFAELLQANKSSLAIAAEQAAGFHAQLEPILKSFEPLRVAINSPEFSAVMDEVRRSKLLISDVSRIAAEQARFTAAIQPYVADIHRAAEGMNSIAGELVVHVAPMTAIMERWLASLNSRQVFDAFRSTFGGRVLKQLAEIETTEADGDVEPKLHGLVEIVDRQTPRAQSSGARFGLALSILSFILTLENMSSESRWRREVREQFYASQRGLAAIERRLDAQQEEDEKPYSQAYVTVEFVKLRDGAGTHFPVLDVVPPNSLVLVHRREGRWNYVRVYDFVDGTDRQGWIYSRYLKAVVR